MREKIFLFFVSILILLPGSAAANDLTGIFYYTGSQRAFESFKKNAASIDIIAPQTYGVNAKGELKGELPEEFFAIARENNVKIMPLVVNSGFSQSALASLLVDRKAQDRLVKAMIKEAKEKGYYGWQFDFEQMTADKRAKYSAFVRRAYPKFKKEGLVFSVAVIAQVSEDPDLYPNNLWQRVIGVYDYEVLGKYSDFLSIMSYDQPKSGGPVASLPWVEKVVKFALTKVPASKLSLGVPFYFWKWDARTGKMVDMGGYGRISELTKSSKQVLRWGWHPEFQVAFVDYYQNRKLYTAWYENQKSFERKLDLANKYGLAGFSAWAIGLEDPKIYSYLGTRDI